MAGLSPTQVSFSGEVRNLEVPFPLRNLRWRPEILASIICERDLAWHSFVIFGAQLSKFDGSRQGWQPS